MSHPAEQSCGSSTEEILSHELSTTRLLTNYHEWIFQEIQPFLGNDITEIGGGLGTFSDLLIRNHLGMRTDATIEIFEPASQLFSQLRQQYQARCGDLLRTGRIRLTNAQFASPSSTYDSVILINGLEHVEYDRNLVHEIHASLRRKGTLIVFSPALPFLYSALDKQVGHFRRYKKDLLASLFTNAGFTIAKLHYMDIAGIVPWYFINVLGGSCSFNPSLVKAYDRLIVPVMRRVEKYCGTPIGKNILIVGRKA